MQDIFRLALLYAHLLAFAITLSAIAREDWRLLRRGFVAMDIATLRATTQVVMPGLIALLLTGAGIAAIDTDLQWTAILERPKLMAKLCVVLALLANGVALHTLAFPQLERKSKHPRLVAALMCLSGAISSVSWLYAGFLGIAKPLVGRMDWSQFMMAYGLLVAIGFIAALLLAGRQIVRLLSAPNPRTTPGNHEEFLLAHSHSTL